MVFYLYVVDEPGRLVGVVSLRRLLLVLPETPLKAIMTRDPVRARVASMGGNAAIQTLTVIVRGMALGELTWGSSWRALGKEVVIGLANGVVFGLVGAGVAWWTVGNPYFGGVLALAMVVNLLVAAFAATLIPMVLRALKADPALASAVFITTLTDVLGFLAFLGLATFFLRYL